MSEEDWNRALMTVRLLMTFKSVLSWSMPRFMRGRANKLSDWLRNICSRRQPVQNVLRKGWCWLCWRLSMKRVDSWFSWNSLIRLIRTINPGKNHADCLDGCLECANPVCPNACSDGPDENPDYQKCRPGSWQLLIRVFLHFLVITNLNYGKDMPT